MANFYLIAQENLQSQAEAHDQITITSWISIQRIKKDKIPILPDD